MCQELEGSLDGLEERIGAIQARLTEIAGTYRDARYDRSEKDRNAKKKELVEKLQQLYGDEVVSSRSCLA